MEIYLGDTQPLGNKIWISATYNGEIELTRFVVFIMNTQVYWGVGNEKHAQSFLKEMLATSIRALGHGSGLV